MSIMQTHERDCDVLVAGGGPAGVPCAVAAARCGARVILCQDRPVLGGNASSEVRMHIVGANAMGHCGQRLATEPREGGIIEYVRLENCVQNPQRCASMMDLILYDLCRAKPNLMLMLNTHAGEVEMDDRRISRVTAERPSTEDRFLIHAKVFVDCTGDGGLGAAAGACFTRGREPGAAYGEPLAIVEGDGKSLGSSILFQARDFGRPMPFRAPSWARTFTEEELRLRPHGGHGTSPPDYGFWWAEWGGQLDTIKDNERIRDELLAIVLGVWDHIKNGGDHGADNWALTWFGFLPGKRESRRFMGQHRLCESDVTEARHFDDAIAFGGWPIDTHPPEGVDAPNEQPCDQNHLEHLFEIPLRACVSENVSNLMFAGRNISATHIAFASTRVMATCAVVGQGVGTAAAYACANNLVPDALASHTAAVHAIQQRLLRDDAFLIGQRNEDPYDRARSARVTASSELAEGPAANTVSGQTRAVHGPKGAIPAQANPGTHRWMSDPAEGLPAWLELAWDEPVALAEVALVFDTALHERVMLTHMESLARQMRWGEARPETVRDYRVEARIDGEWRTVAEVAGNYQRHRVHRFEPVTADALRVVVEATQGLDHARICEVRAYGPDAPVFV